MKRSILIYLFPLLILGSGSLFAQVELRVNGGGGLLLIQGDVDRHEPGFRIQAGLSAEGAIPRIRDLSWAIGVEAGYAQADLYRAERGSYTVINKKYPIDESRRFVHTFSALDLPLRLRYNAFGFMGLSAGMTLSYTLDWTVDFPAMKTSNKIYQKKKNLVSAFNVGLFFPVSDRIRIDLEGILPREARFYDSKGEINRMTTYDDPYLDYSIIAKVSYRLIGDKNLISRK